MTLLSQSFCLRQPQHNNLVSASEEQSAIHQPKRNTGTFLYETTRQFILQVVYQIFDIDSLLVFFDYLLRYHNFDPRYLSFPSRCHPGFPLVHLEARYVHPTKGLLFYAKSLGHSYNRPWKSSSHRRRIVGGSSRHLVPSGVILHVWCISGLFQVSTAYRFGQTVLSAMGRDGEPLPKLLRLAWTRHSAALPPGWLREMLNVWHHLWNLAVNLRGRTYTESFRPFLTRGISNEQYKRCMHAWHANLDCLLQELTWFFGPTTMVRENLWLSYGGLHDELIQALIVF